MTQIRTRVAPSPTGDPHVGTAYIALFNRCYAHARDGKFVLRIEDTDKVRSTVSSEQKILESLRWLGLSWDEGPDVGGEFGPYRQSERSEIYQQHICKLLEEGHAFRCFCTPQRLQELRADQMRQKTTPGYDGHCLHLDPVEVDQRVANKELYVVRMKIPAEGECQFTDGLRGDIAIPWSQVDMQVLIKSDGLPTYHFANVVDDHLMHITDVIRGEEWINSTPKHLLLYQYFDWQAPRFFHMPLLRNPDKSKLSKRKNPTSIFYYRDMGYLPEAVLNYLAMMGWTLPSGEEKFSLQEMQDAFDIRRVSLGGPIFDLEKLDWLNGKYIRENLTDQQLADQFLAWAAQGDRLHQLTGLVQQRVEKFSDLVPLAAFMFSGLLELDAANFQHKSLDDLQCRKILQFFLWRLEALETWDRDSVEQSAQALAAAMGLKIRDFLFPLFVAVTGRPVSISVIDAMAILGLDMVRARLRSALKILGGFSKKQVKEIEHEYQRL
jgi:glutamyl-tRNA synthetase